MKTRILRDIACVHGAFRQGQVLLLAADVAQPLIDIGFAEFVWDQPNLRLSDRRAPGDPTGFGTISATT